MKLAKSKFLGFFIIISMVINMFMFSNVRAYNDDYFDTGEISGYTWFDFDGNGKWEWHNPNENVISGVKVDLCDANNQVLKTTTTSYYGQYFFKDLCWGSYKVKVHLPSGYTFTDQGNGNGVQYRISKVDPSTGITDTLYPTNRAVNIGLIKGQTNNTDDTTPPPVQGSLMDINRTLDKNTATLGQTVEVKYTVNPKPVLTQQDSTQKDIVLVIDTSGSMADAPSSSASISKLDTIKSVATNFINSFKGNQNVNIALIDFDNQAKNVAALTNMKSGDVTNLSNKVNGLRADGSTNIGDGLRIAYNQLNNTNGHNKYIVFMTDGQAEAYSWNSQGYIMGTETVYSNNIYSTYWDYYHRYANPDYRTQALEYAKKVASEKVGNSNIKSFFVGFGTEANSSNVQIANAAKGTYQSAIDKTTVAKIYDGIQKQIDSTIQGTAAFQETFSSNLEVDRSTLPQGLSVNESKITGNINVDYTLNSEKTQYEHNSPVEFTVKYKVNSKANCILGQSGNSSLVKLDVSNKTETKYLPEKVLTVTDGDSNNNGLMNISRSVDAQSLKIGDVFTAKYNIKTSSILAQQDTTQKDIVLVMDTSTSMKDSPNGSMETSKLDIVKSVAKNFVSKFNNNSKVNIALVEFNSLSKEDEGLTNMGGYNAGDTLNDAIDSFRTDSNTNIGEGLRKAYYMLNDNNGHDKYIILMTDGAANTYSVSGNWNGNSDSDWRWYQDGQVFKNYGRYVWNSYKGWVYCSQGSYYWSYYMDSSDPGKYACFGNNDLNGLVYAKKIASEKIANSKIKSFIVGFGSDADTNNSEIAAAAKGVYQSAQDETSINNVYDQIQKQIDSNIHGTEVFQETFSSNLEVDTATLPAGLKVDGNKVTGTMDLQYTLSSDKTQYMAVPNQFEIKYKVKSSSDCILGQGGNSSSVQLSVTNQTDTKYFPELTIPVLGDSSSTLPQVNINITDGTGTVDNYIVNSNNANKKVDKFLPGETKLKGDAYANISFQSQTANIFQYKIVPYSIDPKDVNIDTLADWQTLNLQQQTVNNDVVTDKQGYLNQRSYDVSHLPYLNNTVDWSNPNQVFKNPFSAAEYKAATYSKDAASYGKWEDYIKEDGSKGKRWVTNSIFLPNMFISNDYKEASKFWGYIKVPNDGSYYFGAISDDGCRGYITVDGETKTFVDMFKPQGATPGTTGVVFNLKSDTYYPIYLEYSNWGGSAAFELRYSNATMDSNGVNNASRIPTDWFYPSKTLSPGEYTDTIFTGSTGVKFPKEPGKYYVAYRTGQKDANGNIGTIDREGFYGGFTVEKKADLVLKREISNSSPKVGDEIEIKCTITPKPFNVSSVYPDGNGPDTYTSTVSNLIYQDVFPKGITPISKNDATTVINGQKISMKLPDNIVYTKDGTEYKASPITFSVYAKFDLSGNYVLQGSDSVVTYTDIDGAKMQLNFNDVSINSLGKSDILKQGIYEKNNVSHQYLKSKQDTGDDLKIVEKMPVELGMLVDIKTSKPTIKLDIIGTYVTGTITFKKYELNSDGAINMSIQPQIVSLPSSGLEMSSTDMFKMDADKKYLITYGITPNGAVGSSIVVHAYIDNKTEPDEMILIIDKMPIVQ